MGMARDVSTQEVRAKLADLHVGLTTFVRGISFGEDDHLRLVVTANDSKGSRLVRYHSFYVKLVVDML